MLTSLNKQILFIVFYLFQIVHLIAKLPIIFLLIFVYAFEEIFTRLWQSIKNK